MKMMQSFSRSFTGLAVLLITAGCGQEAPTQLGEVQRLFQEVDEEVTGAVGDLVPAVSVVSAQSHLGPGSIDITPASPTFVRNCIPFGRNTGGFSGFIYRNVPPFSVAPGSRIAFDLGALNDVDVRRNIYLATANMNPAPVPFSPNVVSQGIFAASGWSQVVSDAQVPLSPRGNLVAGDYELVYTIEAPFTFPGGGLIVGFGGSPPGAYRDSGCEQVLVRTDGGDASGFFYARFFSKPDQTLGVLDVGTGGTGIELGGIVIEGRPPCVVDTVKDLLDQFVADGKITAADTAVLRNSLDVACKALGNGNKRRGYRFLQQFITDLKSLWDEGAIATTHDDVETLRDAAAEVMRVLRGRV